MTMSTIMTMHASKWRYIAQVLSLYLSLYLVALGITILFTWGGPDFHFWSSWWCGWIVGSLIGLAIKSVCQSHKKFDVTLSETTLCAPQRTGRFSFQRTEVPIGDLDLVNSRISRFRESYVMTNEGQKLIIASGYHSMRSIRTLYGKIDEAIRQQRLS